MVIEMNRQFKPMDRPENIPHFQYKNHTYQLLNLGLDVDADGVTYHLSSEFAGKDEMGAVIDLIELERTRRNSA